MLNPIQFIKNRNSRNGTKQFANIIANSMRTIDICNWKLDMSEKTHRKKDETFHDLILNKAQDGVKFTILYNNNVCYNPANNLFHDNIRYKRSGFNMYNSTYSNIVFKNNTCFPFRTKDYCDDYPFTYNSMHQRYMLIDNKKLLIGTADIGSSSTSNINYFEFGILLDSIPNKFIQFVQNNFESGGNASIVHPLIYGNFKNHNTEYDFLKAKIEKSKKQLFISGQYFASNLTQNNTISDSIITAVKQNPDLRVTCFIESQFNDNPGYIYQLSYIIQYKLTLFTIRSQLTNEENSRFICTTFANNDVNFIHSKLFLFDNQIYLTTSNILDRSFYKKLDREIGFLITKPDAVKATISEFCAEITGTKINYRNLQEEFISSDKIKMI